MAIGSASYAFFQIFVNVAVLKLGASRTLILGIRLMIINMIFYMLVCILSTRNPQWLHAFSILQIFIGLPLALCSNPDTILTREILQRHGAAEHMNAVEKRATVLKYRGVPLGSLVGTMGFFLLFLLLRSDPIRLVKQLTVIFLLSSVGPFMSWIYLRHIKRSDAQNVSWPGALRTALQHVRAVVCDKALLPWLLLIGSIEGWLLHTRLYFDTALFIGWLKEADSQSPWLKGLIVLLVPSVYWLLTDQSSNAAKLVRLEASKCVGGIDTPSTFVTGAALLLVVFLVITLYLTLETLGQGCEPLRRIMPLYIIPLLSACCAGFRSFFQAYQRRALAPLVEAWESRGQGFGEAASLCATSVAGRVFHIVIASASALLYVKVVKGWREASAKYLITSSNEAQTLALTMLCLVAMMLTLAVVVTFSRRGKNNVLSGIS